MRRLLLLGAVLLPLPFAALPLFSVVVSGGSDAVTGRVDDGNVTTIVIPDVQLAQSLGASDEPCHDQVQTPSSTLYVGF